VTADVECPDCGGRGWYEAQDEGTRPRDVECETCDGRGLLAPEATRYACDDAYDSLEVT
jgi:DnaJ-class molecular chaperone